MQGSEEKLANIQDAIKAALGAALLGSEIKCGELSITVVRDYIREVMHKLRDDAAIAMVQLTDICGVDYPSKQERFEVVYRLLSFKHNCRVGVKVVVEEDMPVPSIVSVYSSAGWYEREVWDMFGIPFSGHPDLRRILTDCDFEGHPLRKDFPLGGKVELRYDTEKRRVAYEPIRLVQDYCDFDLSDPREAE